MRSGTAIIGFFANDSFLLTREYSTESYSELVYKAWDFSGNLIAKNSQEEMSDPCYSDFGRGRELMASPGGKFLIHRCSDGVIILEKVVLQENSNSNSQNEESKQIILGRRKRINLFSSANVDFAFSEVSASRDDLTWLISNSEGSLYQSKLWSLNKQDIQRPKILKFDNADLAGQWEILGGLRG